MAEREQRVTPLELFFDLVFVFAITQVTLMMSDNPTWPGVGGGLIVLAALWWAWTGYAWLTNLLEPEEGPVRAGMFAAMAAMLIVALAVPEAFGADGVLFGVAYLIVRLLQLQLFAIAGKRDPDLLGAVLRMLPPATLGPLIIVAAGFFDGRAQTALWLVALAVDYGGVLIGRGRGLARIAGTLRRTPRSDRDHRPRRVDRRDRRRRRRRVTHAEHRHGRRPWHRRHLRALVGVLRRLRRARNVGFRDAGRHARASSHATTTATSTCR